MKMELIYIICLKRKWCPTILFNSACCLICFKMKKKTYLWHHMNKVWEILSYFQWYLFYSPCLNLQVGRRTEARECGRLAEIKRVISTGNFIQIRSNLRDCWSNFYVNLNSIERARGISLISKMKDIVVFLTWEVFNSDNLLHWFKVKRCISLYWKTTIENNHFFEEDNGHLMHS